MSMEDFEAAVLLGAPGDITVWNQVHAGNYKYFNTLKDAEARRLLGKDAKSLIQMASECGRGPVWIMQNCPFVPVPTKAQGHRLKRKRNSAYSDIASLLDVASPAQPKRTVGAPLGRISPDMAEILVSAAAAP
ncbi:hypothetical protein M885DRAFT_579816 [Pelagophyceae sp. CCMP2097]|nr:hypothetical protein M885DRAFT_579816 [Pelagophyceae sp. CCMP2097]